MCPSALEGYALIQQIAKEGFVTMLFSRRLIVVLAGMCIAFSPHTGCEPIDDIDYPTEETPRFWPMFPKPTHIYETSAPRSANPDVKVMEQTLSGLIAYQSRKADEGVYFKIEDGHEAAQMSYQSVLDKYDPAIETIDGDAWALLDLMAQAGRVQGYVLYRRDDTPLGEPLQDTSLNIAVSLCAPLQAVAIEEHLQNTAEELGLALLEDVRDKDHDWLFDQYGDSLSRDLVGLADPRRDHHMRDLTVAVGASLVSTGPGGGYTRALDHAKVGGAVFGWDTFEEIAFVIRASEHGLTLVPADWLLNLPLYMAGQSGLDYPFPERPAADPAVLNDELDDDGAHYVAFVLSDGDNLCWTTGSLATESHVWGSSRRGELPFGWGAAIINAMQANPHIVDYLLGSATEADELLQYSTGYCYLDRFGKERGSEDALATLLQRCRPYLESLNAVTIQSFATEWNSEDAQTAYQVVARELPALKGLLVTQYHPYAAGRGAIEWFERPDNGDPLAVITPLIAMWEGPQDANYFATVEGTARAINDWAAAPVEKPEDRFTWVVIHAWSEFPDAGGARCYDAALACAEQLDEHVRVVTPTEMVRRLHQARASR